MEERRKEDVVLRERLVALEVQVERLLSHLESEKGTKQRVADAIEGKFLMTEERMRAVEHTVWKAAGAVTVILAVLGFVINIIVKHL
jgi:hypothetical protein